MISTDARQLKQPLVRPPRSPNPADAVPDAPAPTPAVCRNALGEMTVLLDENWLDLAPRVRALGYVVERIQDGRTDGRLILEAITRRTLGERVAIVTRDKGFAHKWGEFGRSFNVVVVQAGPRNTQWPRLLARGLQRIADTDVAMLVMIRKNRLRIVRSDGVS